MLTRRTRDPKDFSRWIKAVEMAMHQKGVDSLYELSVRSGVPYGTLTGNMYKRSEPRTKRKHQPRETTVRKLAQFFGAESDYMLRLAGYDLPQSKGKEVRLDDPDMQALITDVLHELTEDERESVKAYMRFTLEQKRHKLKE